MIPDRLDTLVRARLVATKKSPPVTALVKSCRPFAPITIADTELRTRIEDSLARVAPLGPGPVAWKPFVEVEVPSQMLGVSGQKLATSAWVPAILGRYFELWTDSRTPPKLTALCDALVWRELGLTGAPRACPDAVRALFLRKAMPKLGPGTAIPTARVLAASIVRAPRADAAPLRTALVRMWLAGETLGAAKASFADDLRRAARGVHIGVFGDDKVFLSSAWRELVRRPAWSALALDDFKARVLAEHRAGRIALARADLVGAMDPDLVSASETLGDGARFHFLVREPS